ncbi:MAG TPA: helix-turn-helix transcriptional regulator [Paracoccaceae bacterium]|nr:helix-turn-helix transcriptional regulator [Paracoccaceae bacterium]
MDVFSRLAMVRRMKKMIAAALLSSEMHPDRVGERITALRMTLHLSKAQFADGIELDRSTLGKVEKGTKGLDIVVGARIAELYGVGLDFLYRGELSDVPEDMRIAIRNQLHAARTARLMGDKPRNLIEAPRTNDA